MAVALSLGLGALACLAQDCGPYRVGVIEFPHRYERQADGSYAGLDKDFFEALAGRSGCRLELQLESQPRLWRKLASGDVDISSWVIPSPQRAAIVKVIPLVVSRPMALTRRELDVRSEADFLANPALRAIAIHQSLYGEGYDALFTKLRAQGRLSEVADFETALRAFSARRADLLVVHPWSLMDKPADWMAGVRLSDWHAANPGLTAGLALSRQTVREADAGRIEQTLADMRRDGSLAHILSRHVPAYMFRVLP